MPFKVDPGLDAVDESDSSDEKWIHIDSLCDTNIIEEYLSELKKE